MDMATGYNFTELKKKLSAGESSGDPAPARDRLPQTADQTERFRTRVAGKLRGLLRDRGFDGRLEHRLRRLRALGAHDQA